VTAVVGVMARAPSTDGKSRLAPHLSPSRLIALREALLADTVRSLADLPDVTVFFTPDDAEAEIATVCGEAMARIAQGAGDLGARMLRALQYLLRCQTVSDTVAPEPQCLTPSGTAILVGSDVPFLTADHLRDASDSLRDGATGVAERVVLGPADDGGYYLIGMTQPHPELFDGIEWGTESVLTDTLRAADRIGVEAHLTRSAYDVDTLDDLLRLERDLAWAPSSVCPALRRWLAAE